VTPADSSACGVVWRCLDDYRDLLAVHHAHPRHYPFLLESVVHGTRQARYDILLMDSGKRLFQDAHETGTKFLEQLQVEFQDSQTEITQSFPLPFHGGWFLYLGYELARSLEPSLTSLPVEDTNWPTAIAVRCSSAIIYDHENHQTWLVAEVADASLLDVMQQDLQQVQSTYDPGPLSGLAVLEEEDPDLYLKRISRVQEYIRAGDTYQVNLSRRWSARFKAAPSPAQLYARLRTANPAPFAGLAVLGKGRAIISSSPELLVSVSDGKIRTRPIAGSWPRTGGVNEDPQQITALRKHPKERAEHVMLVDLERNDLGRLCEPGTVRADELLTVESYRHVHHLVSGVSGKLRPDVSPVDVIRAVFPGGTITGCPKLRTMQIIGEQEGVSRGAYTGSMGFLNRDGSMVLNILIRTMVLNGSDVEWRAGGGIVADSDPQRELNETRAKSRGLLAALGMQGSGLC